VFKLKPLGRAWGMLFCADERGAQWTVLGDPAFVEPLRVAQRPLPEGVLRRAQPPSPSPAPPSGKGLTGELVGEFPVDEFRPQWLVRGWADEWSGLGRIEVWP
jgi:hypothetical protein